VKTSSGLLLLLPICVCAAIVAIAAPTSQKQDKYTLKVPGGLAFAEFKGYESWETISVSHNGPLLAVILGNPTMINAYKAGFPANGKVFPDGSKMAKIHWVPKVKETAPGQPQVPDVQRDVDFMVKDSRRFADSGGWGYAVFKYDSASGNFVPAGEQAGDSANANHKCGLACHTIVKGNDYVFTEYAPR
jgi:hypothetical protein